MNTDLEQTKNNERDGLTSDDGRITLEKSLFVERDHSTIRYLLYFEKRKVLVSILSQIMRFWRMNDNGDYEIVVSLEPHNREILHLVKLTSDIFLSCARDGHVYSYSIDTMKCTGIVVHLAVSNIKRMLRLSDDLFIPFRYGRHQVPIVSFSQRKIIRKLGPSYRFHSFGRAVKSKKHENCIITNFSRETGNVQLISTETGEIVKFYGRQSGGRSGTNCLASYLTQSGDEIIIAGGSGLRFYNTEISPDPIFSIDKSDVGSCHGLFVWKSVSSRFCYLFAGSTNNKMKQSSGWFNVYDLRLGSEAKEGSYKPKLISTFRSHEGGILEFTPLSIEPPNKLIFASCAYDSSIKIVSFSGDFTLLNSMEREDLLERVSYLRNVYTEDFGDSENDSTSFCITLNETKTPTFKFLFCLM